jgi:hypothetical protein
MLTVRLLIEDQQREPTKKPEAIASGFSLSCPNNFEPLLIQSLRMIKKSTHIETIYFVLLLCAQAIDAYVSKPAAVIGVKF